MLFYYKSIAKKEYVIMLLSLNLILVTILCHLIGGKKENHKSEITFL